MKATIIVIATAILIFIGIIFYNKSGNREPVATSSVSPTVSASLTPENSTMTENTDAKIAELQKKLDDLMKKDEVKIQMTTPAGVIDLVLYPKVAPKTVANFLSLSLQGFYDGLKFHRVVDGFVVQGGDPLSRTDDPRVGSGGPGYQFEDEINARGLGLSDEIVKAYEARGYKYNNSLQSLPMTVGALAMANSGPNTNGSQFFIVTEQDQPHLTGLHTVFGKVLKGMDVVLKIKQGDTMKVIVK